KLVARDEGRDSTRSGNARIALQLQIDGARRRGVAGDAVVLEEVRLAGIFESLHDAGQLPIAEFRGSLWLARAEEHGGAELRPRFWDEVARNVRQLRIRRGGRLEAELQELRAVLDVVSLDLLDRVRFPRLFAQLGLREDIAAEEVPLGCVVELVEV